jgi:hypothetical protein
MLRTQVRGPRPKSLARPRRLGAPDTGDGPRRLATGPHRATDGVVASARAGLPIGRKTRSARRKAAPQRTHLPLSASRRARMLAVQKRQWDESCPHYCAAPSAPARACARPSSATRRSRCEGGPIWLRSGPIGNPLHILLRPLEPRSSSTTEWSEEGRSRAGPRSADGTGRWSRRHPRARLCRLVGSAACTSTPSSVSRNRPSVLNQHIAAADPLSGW